MANPEMAPQPDQSQPMPPMEAQTSPEKPIVEAPVPKPEKQKEISEAESQMLEEKQKEIDEIDTKIPDTQPADPPKQAEPAQGTASQYEEMVAAEKGSFFDKLAGGLRKLFSREISNRELNKMQANLEHLENYCLGLFADVDTPEETWNAKKEGVAEILAHMEKQIQEKTSGPAELIQDIERKLVNLKAALQEETARHVWMKDRPGTEEISAIRTDDLVQIPPEMRESEIAEDEIVEEEKVA